MQSTDPRQSDQGKGDVQSLGFRLGLPLKARPKAYPALDQRCFDNASSRVDGATSRSFFL